MRGDEALAGTAGAAVQLEGVSYTYPGAAEPTLRSVSLEVPAGQCVVVTGPSGCGKTTLSRLVNGLVPHVYAGEVTGRVLVGGTDVEACAPDELGVREEDIPALAVAAFNDVCTGGNPRPTSVEEIERLYHIAD